MNNIDNKMKAAILEKFGGPKELLIQNISIPEIGVNEILIKVEYAGIGQWDIFEREGGYAQMLGIKPKFPYVLGSEGAGTIYAIGKEVSGFNVGDKVYAPGFLNSKGGFYAEYVTIDSKYVLCIPGCITTQEASVISGVGITALRGLEDILKIKQGESVLIFGASGGVGHLAVQLAKNIGAKVFAVASGEDGVDMIRKFGADVVVNGRKDDILLSARSFAPEGFDAILLTSGDEMVETVIKCVRPGGRIAYPKGIYPEPKVQSGIRLIGYNGDPDPEIIQRLNKYINSCNLRVHIDKMFLLEDACNAHLSLNKHYLGKLCLQVSY